MMVWHLVSLIGVLPAPQRGRSANPVSVLHDGHACNPHLLQAERCKNDSTCKDNEIYCPEVLTNAGARSDGTAHRPVYFLHNGWLTLCATAGT